MTDHSVQTIDPFTEQPLQSYPLMDAQTVERTIRDCHQAHLDWRMTSLADRAAIIAAVGQALSDRKEEFAALMTAEVGKLLKDARDEIDLCAAICAYTAKQGPDLLADERRDLMDGRQGVISYAPVGVVYGIQPWNFPCYQAVRYSIASLMAGNGVLLKHAANCTGSGLLLREIYEQGGLPKGLFSVLVIDHDQSDAVIGHPLVRGVTLTGSPEAGKVIAGQAAEHLKKTVMELGSNDAYLVLADADLDLAVKTCVAGRIYNNGETCVNAKRFVVVDAVYDRFLEAFVQQMQAVKTGDPREAQTALGPMARADLRDKLHDQVQESIQKGARLLCGGTVPEGSGFFYPATVLDQVAPGQPAYDEELFGPVASVIRAKDDADAMRIANDSEFGLGGGIFSADQDRALDLARRHFDTGMVFINNFNLATPEMPFGGVKHSGYGREHGGFGMMEFVNIKAITLPA